MPEAKAIGNKSLNTYNNTITNKLPLKKSDEENDISNIKVKKGHKKSKGFLLNKRSTHSPKLNNNQSSISATSYSNIDSLVDLYKSSNPSQRLSILDAVIKEDPQKAFLMFSKLPHAEIEKFAKELLNVSENLIIKSKSLSLKEKKKLEELLKGFKAYIEENDSKDVSAEQKHCKLIGDDMCNIMMIIIKAFTDNMNTESLDEISQINQTTLINKFLDVAKKVLSDNMKNNADLMTSSGHDYSNNFWAILGTVIGVAFVSIVAPEFMSETEELGSITADSAEESEAINTEIDNTQTEVNQVKKELDMAKEKSANAEVKVNDYAGGTKKQIEEAQEELENAQQKVENLETKYQKTQEKLTKIQGQGNEIRSARAELREAQNNEDKCRNEWKNAEKSEKNLKWKKLDESMDKRTDAQAKLKDALNNRKYYKGTSGTSWSKDYYKDGMPKDNDWNNKVFSKATLKAFKRVLWDKGLTAAGACFGAYMLLITLKPEWNRQAAGQPDQAKVIQFNMVAQYENDVINQNNNVYETTSKRMSDDSERVSQSSGYVQQAINMYGQAMSFRA